MSRCHKLLSFCIFVLCLNVVSAYQKPYRLLQSKNINGWNVVLDDGSAWRVEDYQEYKVRNWDINDAIVIHPKWVSATSRPKYYLKNETKDSTVTVELWLTPFRNQATHTTLTYANSYSGDATITDGNGQQAFWVVDYLSGTEFAKWQINDTIIIAGNEGSWYEESYTLINTNLNTYVKARLR